MGAPQTAAGGQSPAGARAAGPHRAPGTAGQAGRPHRGLLRRWLMTSWGSGAGRGMGDAVRGQGRGDATTATAAAEQRIMPEGGSPLMGGWGAAGWGAGSVAPVEAGAAAEAQPCIVLGRQPENATPARERRRRKRKRGWGPVPGAAGAGIGVPPRPPPRSPPAVFTPAPPYARARCPTGGAEVSWEGEDQPGKGGNLGIILMANGVPLCRPPRGIGGRGDGLSGAGGRRGKRRMKMRKKKGAMPGRATDRKSVV